MKPATPPKPTPSAVNRQPLALNVRKGTRLLFSVLAETRGLSARGVALASKRGLVRFGRYRDQAAWFLLDASRRNACARRLDGGQWFAGTDDRAKSLIIRGAHAAWPIGIQEAQPFETILLCEGGPDLLAAFHFIAAQCREFECAAVAMLSASYSIPAETLPLFAGKRVRIFPHDDSTGYRAASQWTAQLKPHAAAVDSFTFRGLRNRNGEKVKDLNDFARAKLSDQALPTSLLP